MRSGAGLLAALRAVAPSDGQARAAPDTFLLAQSVGWDKARALRTKATLYRDLGRLSDAGASVPLRPYSDKRAAHTSTGPSLTLADCHQAVGLAFTVTNPWEPEFYPAGVMDRVEALLFRRGRWLYLLAFEGSPGGYEELPVRAFHQDCVIIPGGAPDASRR